MYERKLRILIVEDEPVFAKALERLFAGSRFDAVVVHDPELALHRALQEIFDLIISDFRLPHMDGLVVLVGLSQAGQKVPFILLTAYYSETVESAAKALGAAAVLEKPVELEVLKNHCEKACRGITAAKSWAVDEYR